MKDIAKQRQLPPVYTGKWASATDEEVQEELAKGIPYTYRFRVPKEGSLNIDDLIRGRVSSVLGFLSCVVVTMSPTNRRLRLFDMAVCLIDRTEGLVLERQGPCTFDRNHGAPNYNFIVFLFFA